MIKAVCSTVNKFSLIKTGDAVIVALSGGADSVTLLDVLYTLKNKYRLKLYCAHLNHGIRGEEADIDEDFCKILCENYKIELFVKRLNIPRLSKERKISEELCGREERYKYFDELSVRLGAKIATAHTASDNAETLLFNLARGSSIAGASAIPPKRGNIIRPLIEVTRDEIEEYCTVHGLYYVTDSTNLSDDYTRNRIRHLAVPALREINPSFEKCALRFSQNAAQAADYLNIQAEKAIKKSETEFGYNAERIDNLHPAVKKTVLAQLCLQNGFTAENKHLELIAGCLKHGGAVQLSDSIYAICSQNLLRFHNNNSDMENYCCEINGRCCFNYQNIQYQVSCDNTKISPVLRTRRRGDRFSYLRRNISKPLRRAMAERRVPAELRDFLPVVAVDNTVLWCAELGFSKQGYEAVDENSLKIKILNIIDEV